MDRARSLSTACGIDEQQATRTFHQLDQVNACHLRLDHLDTVTDFLPEPASRQESDRVVASHAVAKTDDPDDG